MADGLGIPFQLLLFGFHHHSFCPCIISVLQLVVSIPKGPGVVKQIYATCLYQNTQATPIASTDSGLNTIDCMPSPIYLSCNCRLAVTIELSTIIPIESKQTVWNGRLHGPYTFLSSPPHPCGPICWVYPIPSNSG